MPGGPKTIQWLLLRGRWECRQKVWPLSRFFRRSCGAPFISAKGNKCTPAGVLTLQSFQRFESLGWGADEFLLTRLLSGRLALLCLTWCYLLERFSRPCKTRTRVIYDPHGHKCLNPLWIQSDSRLTLKYVNIYLQSIFDTLKHLYTSRNSLNSLDFLFNITIVSIGIHAFWFEKTLIKYDRNLKILIFFKK